MCPRTHTTPHRRLIAGYVGPASGLRTAILTGTALGSAAGAPLITAGGAR
ncbi:hypothetical protein [Micromonospora nigra]|nr:hypothetical protein [Micromonospora nigra]